MNKKRENCAIIYSKIHNYLIVGGGQGTGGSIPSEKSVEYLDLNKIDSNRGAGGWNLFHTNTNYSHCNTPCLWFDKFDNVASLYYAMPIITQKLSCTYESIQF
eukprot:902911_1